MTVWTGALSGERGGDQIITGTEDDDRVVQKQGRKNLFLLYLGCEHG